MDEELDKDAKENFDGFEEELENQRKLNWSKLKHKYLKNKPGWDFPKAYGCRIAMLLLYYKNLQVSRKLFYCQFPRKGLKGLR